jgi:hypothetical protein
MHNVVMSKEPELKERSYFVITDGIDAVGALSFFSTLAEALDYAGDMEAKENVVTVEIVL